MATITRSVLKGIVKECLVEILSEGLTGSETLLESHPSIGLRPDDGPGPGGLPRPALRAARTPGAP